MNAMSFRKNLIQNRKAFHDYEILEKWEAGIVLQGSEVKSLRQHSGSIQEAYIVVKEEELWLQNASISPYSYSSHFQHAEKRPRKLLLHKKEILKLKRLVQEKGFTLIPLSLYIKEGYIKVEIALAKGKKHYDKRAALKAKEQQKEVQRALKEKP